MKENILLTRRISHLFLSFVVPSVISMVLVGIQGMVDGIFLGNFQSTNAMASVNIANPYMQLVLGCSFILCTGTLSYLGRTLGEKNIEQAKNIFKTAAVSVIAISFAILALGLLFHHGIARFLGANAVLFHDTSRYIAVLAPFVPIISFMLFCGFLCRLIEKPHLYLIATICSLLSNILMNAIFIIGLHWGVSGAALATGLSYTLSLLIVIWPFFSQKTTVTVFSGKFQRQLLKSIIYNGSSEGINYLATALILFLFNRTFLRYAGEDGVAAFTAINYIGTFISTVIFGVSDGIGSILSCNYGAGNLHRVKKTFRAAVIINFLLGCSVCIILFLHSGALVNLFVSKNPSAAQMAAAGARIYAFGFLFSGFNILRSGYYTSLGNALLSVVIAANRGILFVIIGITFLPLFLDLNGVWATLPFAECMTALSCLLIAAKKRCT